MSDQQAPQNGDTPAVAGPTQAPGTQEQQQAAADPYEKRYNDLRPEFDRATAERAELAQWKEWAQLAFTTDDTDTQRQALQHLGFDVPEEVEDVEPAEWADEDPLADLRQEIAELRAWKDQSTTQAHDAQAFEYLNGHMQGEIERLGIAGMDDDIRQEVLESALANPGIPAPPGAPHDELPDIEGAWQRVQARDTGKQKRWASVKRSAPYVPPGGLPANEVPDPGTGHNSRMNRAMRALQEQQE